MFDKDDYRTRSKEKKRRGSQQKYKELNRDRLCQLKTGPEEKEMFKGIYGAAVTLKASG